MAKKCAIAENAKQPLIKTYMQSLKEKYTKEIVPALMKKLDIKNIFAVPKITKVKLNVGLGKSLTDPKFNELVEKTLMKISGQKPVYTKSKKSISAFKIRKGMDIGLSVTLRGKRMYDFLTKLINITLPRVRDFHGINPNSIDDRGNLNIGFKEHIVFPEIKSDEIEKVHGLEVCISTTAQDKKSGLALFENFGIPFAKDMPAKDAAKKSKNKKRFNS